MTTKTIADFSGVNIFKLRDVIERFEELEGERENTADAETLKAWDKSEEGEEYAKLGELLHDVCACGSDKEWRGYWYPATFIRESYFKEYARERAEDIGAIDRNAAWPACHIDWKTAADSLKMDYSSVTFDGHEYWYRH